MALVVQIGADVRSAVAGIELVSTKLKDQGFALSKLQQQVNAFGGGVNRFSSNFVKIVPTIEKATLSLKKLPSASNQATASLINLGRVVQDAPFGFLGIANNLNPLLESFQRLKTVTGTTGGALRALAGSLMGAGGLGFAVSIATAALSFFALGSRGAKKDTDDLKESVETAADRQKRLKQEFDNAANAVVGQSDKLKDLQIVLSDTSNSYLTLADSIVKQGIAQFLFSQKEALVQQQLSKEIENRLKVQKQINSLKEFVQPPPLIPKLLPSVEEFKNKGTGVTPKFIPTIEELRKSGIGLNDIEKQLFDINALAASLGLNFKQFVVKPTNIKIDKEFIIPEQELEFRLKLEPAVDVTRFRQVLLDKIPQTLKEAVSEVISEQNRKLADKFGPENNNIIINAQLKIPPNAEKELERQIENINSIIQNIQVDALANIGQAIGTALSGGDLRNVFKSFGNIIGDGLQTIGKQLVNIGVAALLAKKALKSLFSNPALSIAAGVALIAVGAALKSALSGGLPGRHAGGAVAAGQSYVVGESGRELFVPSTSGRIVPGNQMGGIQGSAMQKIDVTVNGKLQLREIVLGVARELKFQQGNV